MFAYLGSAAQLLFMHRLYVMIYPKDTFESDTEFVYRGRLLHSCFSPKPDKKQIMMPNSTSVMSNRSGNVDLFDCLYVAAGIVPCCIASLPSFDHGTSTQDWSLLLTPFVRFRHFR